MQDIKNTITGIILAGGKSRRMGREKPLIEINGKSLIQTSIDLLSPFCSEVIISANSDIYNQFGKKVIKDEIANCGPIGGIYSSIKHSSSKLNLILASDTPYIDAEIIEYLISNASDNRITAIVQPNGHIEPLCAIYPSNITNNLENHIKSVNYKLINILHDLDFKPLLIDETNDFFTERSFKNLNTPEDLR